MSIPVNYLINPKTGNPIKRWGKTHKRLIRDGIMDIMPQDTEDKVLKEISPDQPLDEQIQEVEEKLSDNDSKKFSLRKGSGILENHIVKVRKTPSFEDTVEKISSSSVQVYKDNEEKLSAIDDDELLASEIRELLLGKLSEA